MSDEEIDAHNNAVSRDEAKAFVAELKMAKKAVCQCFENAAHA